MNTIQIKQLSVHYGETCVLDRVNLEVEEGECVAIVGRSGSGKTTLLHAIARLIQSIGEVKLLKKVDVIFQRPSIFPWMTISMNILFGLEHLNTAERQAVLEKNLLLTGLTPKRDAYPGELSGGQIQRVVLARALAHDADILLMDEPYGALDAHTKSVMQTWLMNICATYKKTVVFVTHDLEEAIFLADRIIVLQEKRFLKEYRISFERPRSETLKFTAEFNELRREITRLLDGQITHNCA